MGEAMQTPWDEGKRTSRSLILHSLAVLFGAALICLVYHRYLTEEFVSSDGSNYAAVARNWMNGRGLTSSVVQPGLMTVVPTDAQGQAFVTQAPLWPILLGEWFRVFGVGNRGVLSLCYTLACVAALLCWWLGYLSTRSLKFAYLCPVMLLANPLYMASIAAGYNVGLQSVLIGGLFLLMFFRPTVLTALLGGLLLALGIITRENSLFVFAGLAFSWFMQLRNEGEGTSRYLGLLPDRHFVRWALCVSLALAPAFLMWLAESNRKAEVIGTWDSPTLRMTFLYWTTDFDLGWYFIYDYEGLRIRPSVFFREHPAELFQKVGFQLWVLFAKQTVPALLCAYAWFVPVFFPWFLGRGRAAIVGYAFLIVMLVQTVVASMSFLHVHYYLAFLPVLYPFLVASIQGLAPYCVPWRGGRRWVTALSVACVAYAFVPFVLNVTSAARGIKLPTGENDASDHQRQDMIRLIREGTDENSVIVCSHSPFLAWQTGRTILQYSGDPRYVISDSPMWRRIDAQLHIDYIVLSSLAGPQPPTKLLPGFTLAREVHSGDLNA